MDYDQKLADLNRRAQTLTKTRDAKLREAAQQEQTRDSALAELAELGYPQACTMKTKELEALQTQIEGELEAELTAYETAITEGEKLVAE